MNYPVIFYIIGWIFGVEAALMAPSLIVALIYGETRAGLAFLAAIALCLIPGVLLTRRKPQNSVFYTREGCVTVALCWICMSIMGALPFLFSGAVADPIDAVFETVSGFTTTGASILPEVESLPHAILFWRSFTHWVGGMGVLVFLLSLLPLTGGGYHMNLMKAESPGPTVSKLVPTVRDTAKTLYGIYLFMTVIMLILMLLGRMPLFEALCTTFGTAGTGGFGIKNDSMGSYSPYLLTVTTIFMILFGVNFNVYFLIRMRKVKEAFRCEEARWYLGIIAVSILAITFFIRGMYPNLAVSLLHAAFQVGSIITTTGYSSVDFNLWPETPKMILLLLMFIGACAGSTGGGIKVSRIMIMVRTIVKELHHQLHPRSVQTIKLEGSTVEHETLRAVNVFFIAYMLIFTASVLLISLEGYDFLTNFSAVASALNNIGPGLAGVGPLENFGIYNRFSTFVLTMDMLIGRLEIFPVLVLFYPETWRKF